MRVATSMSRCFAVISVDAEPHKHHDHTHPLPREQGVAEQQDRGQNGEELSGGGDE